MPRKRERRTSRLKFKRVADEVSQTAKRVSDDIDRVIAHQTEQRQTEQPPKSQPQQRKDCNGSAANRNLSREQKHFNLFRFVKYIPDHLSAGIHFCFSHLWRWSWIGAVAAVLIGTGGNALFGGNIPVARVLVYAAIALVTVRAIFEVKDDEKRLGEVIAIFTIGALCITGCEWLISTVQQRHSTEPQPRHAVAIQPTYEIMPLPILVEAGETAYFLPLKPTFTQGLISEENVTNKPMWWPADISELRKNGYGFEMVSRCVLKNYSEIALLNPVMKYEVKFYEGRSSEGKLISRHVHQVSMPVLEKEKPFVFYIVNQTPYLAIVEFPKEVEVEVVGEPNRRTVALVQPKTIDQLFQNMPIGQYVPSTIDWQRF